MKNSTKRLLLSSAVLLTTIAMSVSNNTNLNAEEIYLKSSGLLAWAETMGLLIYTSTDEEEKFRRNLVK